MSPRTATVLAAIGVLLAGIPLPALTAARQGQAVAASAPAAPAPTRAAYALLQCSGQPESLRLRHEGRELPLHAAGGDNNGPWEAELNLPRHGRLSLELEIRWPEGSPAQAATLTLEPDGLPTQQHTEWTPPGSNTLHALYPFSW